MSYEDRDLRHFCSKPNVLYPFDILFTTYAPQQLDDNGETRSAIIYRVAKSMFILLTLKLKETRLYII
jgi:hypothetical protein